MRDRLAKNESCYSCRKGLVLSRYVDRDLDIFAIDNPEFEKHSSDIYPTKLQLNKANTSDKETSFAMSLLDFSPRIPLGTFSILLDINIKVIASDVHTQRLQQTR